MKVLRVYEVSRAYGGPEEGGWWYDHYSLICESKPHGSRWCKKWYRRVLKKYRLERVKWRVKHTCA